MDWLWAAIISMMMHRAIIVYYIMSGNQLVLMRLQKEEKRLNDDPLPNALIAR